MVCHSVCGADDMTDVTIWQNFLHPLPRYPLTLESHNVRRAISLPKVSHGERAKKSDPGWIAFKLNTAIGSVVHHFGVIIGLGLLGVAQDGCHDLLLQFFGQFGVVLHELLGGVAALCQAGVAVAEP